MNTLDIRHALRTYIASAIRTSALADDTDIFEAGLVNSMFAMQILLFIEKTFALTVGNDELDLANFRSVDAMTAFVERKLAVGAAA